MNRAERIAEICANHSDMQGPLLPILHGVQKEFGCIDSDSEALIARELNLTRAEVHGVVSFYHDFSQTADDRPEVQICRAEACQARGVEMLMDDAEKAAGERVRLSTVYCLGLCSVGPNARIGDQMHSRLDATYLMQLIEGI